MCFPSSPFFLPRVFYPFLFYLFLLTSLLCSHPPLSTFPLWNTPLLPLIQSPLLSLFHPVPSLQYLCSYGVLWLTLLFSWQTVLASSGGLYCLSGGCNGIVNISCMSLLWTTFSFMFSFQTHALLWCPAVLLWVAWDGFQKSLPRTLWWMRMR